MFILKKSFFRASLACVLTGHLIFSQPLTDAYQAGATFGDFQQSKAMAVGKKASPLDVPGFQGVDLPETHYSANDMKKVAEEKAATSEAGSLVEKTLTQKADTLKLLQHDALLPNSTSLLHDAPKAVEDTLPNAFCLHGDCAKQARIPNPDFQQAVSALSGTASAAKDFDGSLIFTGNRKECRKDAVDFNNCCADSGWGNHLHLADCHRNEKELGLAKEAGLCHEVGTYCSEDFWGMCLMHSRGYCCFPSKLARIIQEQGHAQLGMDWGDAESPHCQGLTPQQLQQLDLSTMDFSEFYADVKAQSRFPSADTLKKRIQDGIQHFYQQYSFP